MKRLKCFPAAFLLAFGCAAIPLHAANRFFIEDVTIPLGTTGHVIPVKADADLDVYGFSVSLEFDRTKIRITNVEIGSDVASVAPEWNDGTVDNTTGRLFYGVVFDLSGPTITKRMPSGNDLELLRLTIDVVATSETTTVLDLKNVPGTPARLNVLTDANGDSVSPPPALDDGTITITDLRPRIDDILNGEGSPGDTFFIVGRNFDQPDRVVRIGGREAQHTLLGDGQTLSVTVPQCTPGDLTVEVCTQFGCDSRPGGFTCTGPPVPVIQAIFPPEGETGETVLITGQNFQQPGLRVTICGTAADFTILPDGQTLRTTAPPCPEGGCQDVQVCTDIGCDTLVDGFCYLDSGTLFVRGDANASGSVDISDAVTIFQDLFLGDPAQAPCRDALDANDSGLIDISDGIYLLAALFQGGPPIPPPWPDPGRDPTPDDLPDC